MPGPRPNPFPVHEVMVEDLNHIPPLTLENLVSGVLKCYLTLLSAEDGFAVFMPDHMYPLEIGAGAFESLRLRSHGRSDAGYGWLRSDQIDSGRRVTGYELRDAR